MNERLEAITRQLHDLWFDVAEVQSDLSKGTVTIPFVARNQPRTSTGFSDRALFIRSVKSVRLEDTERIGRYDFNELRYAPQTGVLRLTTGVPLTLEITVSEVDVSVEPMG